MGKLMDIEVIGRTYYTVHLTEEDVAKIQYYLKVKNKTEDFFTFDEESVCGAAMELYGNGDIHFFDDGKYTDSDFEIEEINWSEFEERDLEDIFKIDEK